MIRIYAGIALMVALVAGFYWITSHYEEVGYGRARAEYSAKADALRAENAKLREEHEREVARVRQQADERSVRDRERLTLLLKQNKELADWWNTAVPGAARDFIFGGVPAAGDPGTVRPGAGAAAPRAN